MIPEGEGGCHAEAKAPVVDFGVRRRAGQICFAYYEAANDGFGYGAMNLRKGRKEESEGG
jgi:hypothetical protein